MNHHSDNNDKNLDKILKEKLHLFKTVENGQKEAEARKPATVMCKNCMFVAFLSYLGCILAACSCSGIWQ